MCDFMLSGGFGMKVLMENFQLPITATTEQKMISANVFSMLNEAWDRFKRENGL